MFVIKYTFLYFIYLFIPKPLFTIEVVVGIEIEISSIHIRTVPCHIVNTQCGSTFPYTYRADAYGNRELCTYLYFH